jgi:hypothetical protein
MTEVKNLFFLNCLIHQESSTERGLLSNLLSSQTEPEANKHELKDLLRLDCMREFR